MLPFLLVQLSSAADVEMAKTLFERYLQLEREFSPETANLFADDAMIQNTRIYSDGSSNIIRVSSKDYKRLIRSELPRLKKSGHTNDYSAITFVLEDDGVRINATRFDWLGNYSSPFSLKTALREGKWLIVEEISETRNPDVLFLRQARKVPARKEWYREIAARKAGRVRIRVGSEQPFSVTLLTEDAFKALARKRTGDVKPGEVLYSLDCQDSIFEKLTELGTGNYYILMENQSDYEVEFKLECFEVR